MNGAHAELFTYCLYTGALKSLDKAGRLAPLELLPYQSVNGTEAEPHIILRLPHEDGEIDFFVVHTQGQFLVRVDDSSVEDVADLRDRLIASAGFEIDENLLSLAVDRRDIESAIIRLAESLASCC